MFYRYELKSISRRVGLCPSKFFLSHSLHNTIICSVLREGVGNCLFERRKNVRLDDFPRSADSATPWRTLISATIQNVKKCYGFEVRHFCSGKVSNFLTKKNFFDELAQNEIEEMKSLSLKILSDGLCSISRSETQKFLVTMPSSDRSKFQEALYKIHGRHQEYKEVAWRMIHLIFERLENEELVQVFSISESFNMRAYFYFLHIWILHQRLIEEELTGELIDDALFETTWGIFKDWLVMKDIPEYRFFAELQNCQEYMFGLCVAMDQAIKRVDIFPMKIKHALWANLYEAEINFDSKCLELLTKYVIRQFMHIFQIEKDHFLSGFFVWANFPINGMELNPPVIPPLSQKVVYGGYRPSGGSKYLPHGGGFKLIPDKEDSEKGPWRK